MRILLGTCLVLAPSLAAAYPAYPPNAPPPPPPPERAIALTISPLHLLSPIVELTGELRVQRKLGVAAIVGAGSLTAKDSADQDLRVKVAELGASVRYYATGSFRSGLQVGGELMYLYVKLDDDDSSITATGDGLSVGPFLGYKWTFGNGFTAELQAGVAVLAAEAHASDGSTAEKNGRVYPLLNVNAGYSF